MTCRELSELLHDHLAGELPRRTRVALALHLLVCLACRRYTDSYRTTVRLARASPEPEVEGEAVERLLRAVLVAPPGERR